MARASAGCGVGLGFIPQIVAEKIYKKISKKFTKPRFFRHNTTHASATPLQAKRQFINNPETTLLSAMLILWASQKAAQPTTNHQVTAMTRIPRNAAFCLCPQGEENVRASQACTVQAHPPCKVSRAITKADDQRRSQTSGLHPTVCLCDGNQPHISAHRPCGPDRGKCLGTLTRQAASGCGLSSKTH